MGFFKNIFKRKKGGTTVGNLIRGVASSVTNGAFGNGRDLSIWEAKQEQKKSSALHRLVNIPFIVPIYHYFLQREIQRVNTVEESLFIVYSLID